MITTGVVLINLGTPASHEVDDVRRYLIEFLTDGRVIDKSFLIRQLLTRGVIIPRRVKQSAASYKDIWTRAGSPLLVHSEQLAEILDDELGAAYTVALAMRYQTPSIEDALEKVKSCSKVVILPLFPQYASATTGSCFQKVMEIVSTWTTMPELHFVNEFATNDGFIAAFADRVLEMRWHDYDGVLFSFHGLPVSQQRKGCSASGKGCCQQLHAGNQLCYSAQCYATAKAIAREVGMDEYFVGFQSRLGKEKWIQPYAIDVVKHLAESGRRRILVVSPSFVADCLETIYEIGVEYERDFRSWGGEELDYVPSLNTSPLWIDALKDLIHRYSHIHLADVSL